jgi:hypothetical protein
MSHHISPSSVTFNLSGIYNHLQPFFPDVRMVRASPLVVHTLMRALTSARNAGHAIHVQRLSHVRQVSPELGLAPVCAESQFPVGFPEGRIKLSLVCWKPPDTHLPVPVFYDLVLNSHSFQVFSHEVP